MTIRSIDSRRRATSFVFSLFVSAIVVLYTFVNYATSSTKKETREIERKNYEIKNEIARINSELDKMLPEHNLIMKYKMDPALLQKEILKNLNADIHEKATSRFGFSPFTINVSKVEPSPKYYNVAHATIKFTNVDWIFGFEDGPDMAKNLLSELIKNSSRLPELIGDLRSIDNSTLIAYFKIEPKE